MLLLPSWEETGEEAEDTVLKLSYTASSDLDQTSEKTGECWWGGFWELQWIRLRRLCEDVKVLHRDCLFVLLKMLQDESEGYNVWQSTINLEGSL